jgi:hypothetical protein
MAKTTLLLKKIISAVIGVPLFVLGIILIPLPGPGLIICFAALLVLSWGFDGAKVYADKIRLQLKKIIDNAKQRAESAARDKEE